MEVIMSKLRIHESIHTHSHSLTKLVATMAVTITAHCKYNNDTDNIHALTAMDSSKNKPQHSHRSINRWNDKQEWKSRIHESTHSFKLLHQGCSKVEVTLSAN